jgi:hypothetical protein
MLDTRVDSLTKTEISTLYRYCKGNSAALYWEFGSRTKLLEIKIGPSDLLDAVNGLMLSLDKIKMIRAVVKDLGLITIEDDNLSPLSFNNKMTIKGCNELKCLDQAVIRSIYRLFGSKRMAWCMLGPTCPIPVGKTLFYYALNGREIPANKCEAIVDSLMQYNKFLLEKRGGCNA